MRVKARVRFEVRVKVRVRVGVKPNPNPSPVKTSSLLVARLCLDIVSYIGSVLSRDPRCGGKVETPEACAAALQLLSGSFVLRIRTFSSSVFGPHHVMICLYMQSL